MSTDPGLTAVPPGPPWSVDLLADLQAGMYPDEVSAQFRARIAADPQASAILGALDSTVDGLSLLPSPRMPERFALRLDAAIAAESAARAGIRSGSIADSAASSQPGGVPPVFRPGPPPAGPAPTAANPLPAQRVAPAEPDPPHRAVVSLDAARIKRRRWIAGIGIAAAVAAAASITVASLNQSAGGSGGEAGAEPGAVVPTTSTVSPSALELRPGQFQSAYSKINGSKSGPLADPISYAGCMAANDIAQTDVLGVQQVTYRGQGASAIAVQVDATHAKILVVSLKCGIDGNADILAAETVTR